MNPLHGIALKCASVTVFVVMQSLIKATDGAFPPGQVVFFRSFFAMPVILAWLMASGRLRTGVRVQNRAGHLWRGVVGSAAMILSFAALPLLPLPEFMALNYATPLLTVIFAALFLGEKVRATRFALVGLGLAGVLVVLSPRLTGFSTGAEATGAALALGAAVLAAGAMVTVRALVATESTTAIVFWFSALATALSLFTLPFGWVMPSGREATLLILAGLCGGVAQVALTSAYRQADASVIAPFEYSSMLLGLAIGWLVFAEVPTRTTLAGAAIIVLAGLLIIWREHQLGLERRRQRQAMGPQGS